MPISTTSHPSSGSGGIFFRSQPCRENKLRPNSKHTQQPETLYMKRRIVIFLSARLQICATFGAISAIAQKNLQRIICTNSTHASTHTAISRKKCKKTKNSFFAISKQKTAWRNLAHARVMQTKKLQVFCAILRM